MLDTLRDAWNRLKPRGFRSARAEQELDEEVRFHLREEARLRAEAGAPPQEAWDAARREFGNVLLVKEVTREMWSGISFENALRDLRFGARLLVRNKGFAVVSIATLALGIGAA